MKSIVVASTLFFSTLLMAQGNSPFMFHTNGAFAQASSTAGQAGVFVQVNRGTDFAGTVGTVLSFDSFSFTPDGFTDTFGFGLIPDNAFVGDNPAHLVLDVDTSQLANFVVQTCTFSFVTSGCGPGPLGVIHIEWQQNGISANHVITDTQTTFPQAQMQQHTEADSASANAIGSFLGLPLSNNLASAGVSHNSTLEIFKTL